MDQPLPIIPGGFYLSSRSISESLEEKPAHYLKLWDWMLRSAFLQDGKDLRRGQFWTTIDEMRYVGGYSSGSARKPLSKDQVRSAYGHLTETGRITTRKTTRGMVITVCNFDSLQDMKSYVPRTAHHATDLTETTRTPHDRLTEEEQKKQKPLSSSGDEAPGADTAFFLTKKKRRLTGKRLEAFNLFWDAFEYKAGKAEAADSWFDIQPMTGATVTKIIEAAKREAARRPGLIADRKTPKMAQGWLSARRWEDEPLLPRAVADEQAVSVVSAKAVELAEKRKKVMAQYDN